MVVKVVLCTTVRPRLVIDWSIKGRDMEGVGSCALRCHFRGKPKNDVG